MVKLLSSEDVQKIIELEGEDEFTRSTITAMETCFKKLQNGKMEMKARAGFLFGTNCVEAMIARDSTNSTACVKTVNFHAKNRETGLPSVMATIVLVDEKTGFPHAIIDGTYLTPLRTAAASAVATKHLANKKPSAIAIIGAGMVGEAHSHALVTSLQPETVYLVDRIPHRAEKLAEKISKKYGVDAISTSAEEATKKSEVITTCTYGDEVVVKKDWLAPGVHINAVGADTPGKRELEDGIIQNAKVVVDDLDQATTDGEINLPIRSKTYEPEQVHARIGEVLLNQKAGRQVDEEITVFDSTGLAVQDLEITNLLLKTAQKHGLAKDVSFTHAIRIPKI